MEEISKIVFNEEEIRQAVTCLGERITADYEGKTPLLIGVLKGSFIFLSDLARAIDLPCEIDFIMAKSYGMSRESSGVVRIVKDVDADVTGRDVIIVEDILESANTLFSVCEVLKARKPASLKVCVFLDKKVKRDVEFDADYKCFEAENKFLVGYGLDCQEKFRCLPYVGAI